MNLRYNYAKYMQVKTIEYKIVFLTWFNHCLKVYIYYYNIKSFNKILLLTNELVV